MGAVAERGAAAAADYDAKVQTLLDTGAAVDEGMVYWDVRPSRTFPTIEVRASDVPATAAETVLLATLVRAGVMTALESPEAPRPSDLALRAAYWRAARDGVAGEAVDLTGEPTLVPATRLLGTYIHVTRKALDRLGERDRVTDELNRIAAQGNGAMRQRKAWSRNNDAHDVIAEAAAATLS